MLLMIGSEEGIMQTLADAVNFGEWLLFILII